MLGDLLADVPRGQWLEPGRALRRRDESGTAAEQVTGVAEEPRHKWQPEPEETLEHGALDTDWKCRRRCRLQPPGLACARTACRVALS